jgi:hypothetical protein
VSSSQMSSKEYACEFLNGVFNAPRCDWCKHTRKKVYRKGLCRHCYDISREVVKIEAQARAYREQGQPIQRFLDAKLDVARRMAESARVEGNTYGDIHMDDISGLTLEHEFSFISKLLLRKDLFYGKANLFGWSFTLPQRRLIFYLLSHLSREYLRRNRRQKATTASAMEYQPKKNPNTSFGC